MIDQDFCQSQRFFPRIQSALGDFEFQVQSAKLKIGARHIGDQGYHHFLLSRFGRKQICTRRLSGSPEFPPKIELPGCGEIYLSRAAFESGEKLASGLAIVGDSRAATDARKLVRARDAELRSRFQNPGSRYAHVVILLQRAANQSAKLLVLENFPPFLITERSSFIFRGLFRSKAAIRSWNVRDRFLVIGPDGAARTKHSNAKQSDEFFHVSLPPPETDSKWQPESFLFQRQTISQPDKRSPE